MYCILIILITWELFSTPRPPPPPLHFHPIYPQGKQYLKDMREFKVQRIQGFYLQSSSNPNLASPNLQIKV